MPTAAPSPLFTFNGGTVPLAKTNVSASSTVTAQLLSSSGLAGMRIDWSVIFGDDLMYPGGTFNPPALTVGGSPNGLSVSFTAGAVGTAGILQVQLNKGINPLTNAFDPAMTSAAKWWVPTAAGAEVICLGETFQGGSIGYIAAMNAPVRGMVSSVLVTLLGTATSSPTSGSLVQRDGGGGTSFHTIFVDGGAIFSSGLTVDHMSASQFMELQTSTAPATPASGSLRLYYDGTHLKALDSGGTPHTIF